MMVLPTSMIDQSSPLSLLFSSVFFFEITFQFAGFILKRVVPYPGVMCRDNASVVDDKNGKHTKKLISTQEKSSSTSASDVVIQLGPSYVCSIVHSSIVSIIGIQHFLCLYPQSTIHKISNPDQGVIQSNIFFCGYLMYDLYHILLSYPKLGGVDTLLHHLVFIACSIINGYYEILPFSFAWLIIGEVSTIFLNIRWFLIKTGRGHTHALQVVQKLFALTFFLTRVVLYLGGVMNLYEQRTELMRLVYPQGHVPVLFLGISVFLIFAGCLLNIFWFHKIAAIAFGKSSTKTKKTRIAKKTISMSSSSSTITTTSIESQSNHHHHDTSETKKIL